MENYPSNSHASRQKQGNNTEERQIPKIGSGKAKTKKPSGISKFTGAFISEDASNVKSYILSDVIIPAAKKLISDIVRDGIDMFLYGSTSGRSNKSSGSKISYTNFYDRDRRPSSVSNPVRARFDYDVITFPSRGEAEAILDGMQEVIDRYTFVTIADMYDMAQLTAPYTSNKYGWTNISTAEVVRDRDGYIIKLPKASPIDK